MILEFSFFGAIVFSSWLLSSTPLGLLSVIISGAILFSQSIPVNILLLLSLTVLSYVISAQKSQKKFSGLAQLNYGIRLAALFTALLGSALQGYAVAPLLTFLGLLAAMPLCLFAAFFSRHYESMTLKAFLYSVLLPSLVILNVLVKIKTEVKVEWGQWWDLILTVVGLTSLLAGTFFAFLKQKTKPLLIYLSLAWLGLGLFLLVMDAEALTPLAIGALSAFIFTTPILMSLGKQLGPDYERTARLILLGAPGFLGFSVIFYSIKLISTLNVHWIWPVAIAFMVQVLAVLSNDYGVAASQDRKTRLRFFMIVALQILCSAGFYWAEKAGVR